MLPRSRTMKIPAKARLFDLESVFIGEWLGEGMSRQTYRCRMDDQYVIKVSKEGWHFQNASEWEVWRFAGGTHIEEWLAPCLTISTCGIYLVQRYVEPLRDAELPTKLPRFLCDFQKDNFGMLEGRVVARDYGTMVSAIRNTSTILRKVDWERGDS